MLGIVALAWVSAATLPIGPIYGQSSRAGSSDAAEILDDVRPLLRQLEANSLEERDAAEKKLVELGVGILPHLPPVTSRTSGEMKIRLQRIRQSLQQTDAEAFFESSTVTLKGKFTLDEVFSEILDQTGNEIEIQGEGESTSIELECEDIEFWEAIDQIAQQANLRIASFATTNNALVFSRRDDSASSIAAYSNGPFRVDVVSTRVSQPLGYSSPGLLELSYNVSWEPRLKPIFMQVPMGKVNASGADMTFPATNPAASPEIALNLGGCTAQVDVQLQKPDRSVVKLENVTGEFVIAVPGERHKFVFKEFGNGARQSQKYGDVSVVLEGARRNGSVYEMRMLVEFGDAQGALDSFRGWIMSNEAYLLDPKEVRLENVGSNFNVVSNGVRVAYLFQVNGDPNEFQLIYESPASISKQTVQFTLKDIPLP